MEMSRPDSAENPVDLAVFYDENAYPPPVGDLGDDRERWADATRRRAEYRLFWPRSTYREDIDVLIAGCGTAQAARYALRHPNARVVGIDVSESSLRHTRDLRERYRLTNLDLHQQPIERVEELGCMFDHIVCTGVLHHLADPDAGLRALRDVLRPDGAMQLMVYATYGRAGVSMLQEYCRRLGLNASGAEIKDLAETLTALPRDHPLVPLLVESADFRQPAGLADALLHPRDRSYTVPEVYELLEGAGLVFGRWTRQAAYQAGCGAIAATPHAERLASLPPQEQYAAVELLRGTLVRHSLVAYRDDAPSSDQSISFSDASSLGLVAIRVPDTVCVTDPDRMPPEAAAVLLNSAHTYSDLVLPIDLAEKRLFDAIDGERSIAEIENVAQGLAEGVGGASARSFFERLWLYDQIVFEVPG